MEKQENIYIQELEKFINKKCVVKTVDNEEVEGLCKAFDYNHLNVVVMTENEKIVIKNMKTIRRARENPSKIR